MLIVDNRYIKQINKLNEYCIINTSFKNYTCLKFEYLSGFTLYNNI